MPVGPRLSSRQGEEDSRYAHAERARTGGAPGAAYFTSGPVWPSQSHPNSYSSTAVACPSAGSSCPQTWSHFKEKPSGHTPSRCREANPRSATPLMERCAVANGRAGDGWGKQRFRD